MNLAVTSHAYTIPENRMVWRRLAQRHPDSTVTVIVPQQWETTRYGPRVQYRAEPEQDGNYAVVPVHRLNDKGGIYRSIDMNLRHIAPDVWYVAQERYDWSTLQAIAYGRIWARHAKIIGGSTVNIEYTLQKLHHKWKEDFFFVATSGIVAMNCEAAKLLREHEYHKPILVQHGIGADEGIWKPHNSDVLRKELRLEAFVVGYVGALVETKGLLDLAQALVQLDNNWNVLFVGDGPLRRDLEVFFDKRGFSEHVCFAGYKSRSDVPSYMNCMDVLVLPAHTTPVVREQFGLVLTEAMLSGVSVIGSDSGAIPEVIGDAGLIFPEGDAAALAACLERLQTDPALRHNLANQGRQRALKRFSTSALADQFYNFCSALLAGQQPSGEAIYEEDSMHDLSNLSKLDGQ